MHRSAYLSCLLPGEKPSTLNSVHVQMLKGVEEYRKCKRLMFIGSLIMFYNNQVARFIPNIC